MNCIICIQFIIRQEVPEYYRRKKDTVIKNSQHIYTHAQQGKIYTHAWQFTLVSSKTKSTGALAGLLYTPSWFSFILFVL